MKTAYDELVEYMMTMFIEDDEMLLRLCKWLPNDTLKEFLEDMKTDDDYDYIVNGDID